MGEGEVIADLDFAQINARKRLMDARGHYNRPELLSLLIDRAPASPLHERAAHLEPERMRADTAEDGNSLTTPDQKWMPVRRLSRL